MKPPADDAPEYVASVERYFSGKAADYDSVDDQVYWRLSDELLWECLTRFVLPSLPENPRILDSGGGTGRWTDRLLTALPRATSVIFDLTQAMTAEAHKKARIRGYSERLEIQIGDLREVGSILAGEQFDLVINFHNVLGFVVDPARVLSDLVSLLRPGGQIALFAPHLYHGVYFNLAVGALNEAERLIQTGRGRFTESMPDMHFFTVDGLSRDLEAAGAHVTTATGTPVFIYPAMAETGLHGQSARLANLLSDPESFDRVRALEGTVLGREDLCSRANNLFVVGRR